MSITFNKEQLKEIIPHREPMLLIDRVMDIEPGRRVVAVKDVKADDDFLKGHFPGAPIMPGTMIVEAMAQASILIYQSAYKDSLKDIPKYYLGSVKARFMHGVFPGDELRLEAETVRLIPTGAFVAAKAYVKDRQVAEADLIFAVKKNG